MGHLSIHDAKLDHLGRHRYQDGIPIEEFAVFQRSFGGHFHARQTVRQPRSHSDRGSFTYIGSPLQNTRTDLGDLNRGAMIYHVDEDRIEALNCPFAVCFIDTTVDLVLQDVPLDVKGKTVVLRQQRDRIDPIEQQARLQQAMQKVLQMGAENVVGQEPLSVLPPVGIEKFSGPIPHLIDLLPEFVRESCVGAKEEAQKRLHQCGLQIIQAAQEKLEDNGSKACVFNGDLKKVSMQNFMGVEGVRTIDYSAMSDGVWYVQGDNGSGKSTLIEAIVWCLFGECVRSDMKANCCVNDVAEKNCSVRVEFRNGISVIRSRKNSDKAANGVRVYRDGVYLSELDKGCHRSRQRDLENLIGISLEVRSDIYEEFCTDTTFLQSFLRTVVLSGDISSQFLSGTVTARRRLFEEILGFSVFELFMSETRERLRDCRSRLAETKMEKNLLEKDVDGASAAAEQAQAQARSLSESISQHRSRVEQAQGLYLHEQDEYRSAQQRLSQLQTRLAVENRTRQQLLQLQRNRDKIAREIESTRAEINSLQGESVSSQDLQKRLDRYLEELVNESNQTIRRSIADEAKVQVSQHLSSLPNTSSDQILRLEGRLHALLDQQCSLSEEISVPAQDNDSVEQLQTEMLQVQQQLDGWKASQEQLSRLREAERSLASSEQQLSFVKLQEKSQHNRVASSKSGNPFISHLYLSSFHNR